MMPLLPHLIIVPVVLPLVTAALLVLVGEKRRRLKSLINLTATLASLIVSVTLMWHIHGRGLSNTIGVYIAANWEAPFGIVLVADRLSALMLVLVGVVSLASALYAEAAWARANVHFHALFQIQLMGLNGAFLTGDLFNLFVFFEVMLAASYGLQLHGSGWPRVKSGLHYLAVNLLASSLFLIGLATLYGVMGTLSMADVAAKLPLVSEADRGLLHVGFVVLAMAFLVKAAMWPLNAWLVPAYSATSAPVAALFALLTKAGVYVLLRLWTLFFADGGPSGRFGGDVLLYGGLATIAVGAFGVLSTMRLGRIAGFSIVVSSGTLLSAVGFGLVATTSAALYYVVSATLAVSALFLLVELVERIRSDGQPRLADVDLEPGEETNLDDEEAPLIGRAFPVSLALLGIAFTACTVLVAGLPPLSGFIAKVSLLRSVFGVAQGSPAGDATLSSSAWWMLAWLLLSGLAAIVSLSRTGMRYFWSTGEQLALRIKRVEAAAVALLISVCILLTVLAEPVLRYTAAAAGALHAPGAYIDAVLSTKPRPGPTRPDLE